MKFLVCLSTMSKKRKRQHDEAAEAEDNAVLQEETELVSSEDEDTVSSDTSPSSDSSLDRRRHSGEVYVNLHKKVGQGTKHITRAFKKAKTFEVRKIIKRIKTAKYGISLLSSNGQRGQRFWKSYKTGEGIEDSQGKSLVYIG